LTVKEIKEDIIRALFSRGIYTKKAGAIQYLTKCPYCGDKKDPTKAHFYLRINPEDNKKIVYDCFLCPAQGVMTYETLELLEIDGIEKDAMEFFNKTTDAIDLKGINNENKEVNFDFKLPKVKAGEKTKYIENRLGIHLTEQDFEDLRIITSFKDFILMNGIKKLTCKPKMALMLDKDYVGFLSNKNSHILFRDITEKHNISWTKYPIMPESSNNRIWYSIKNAIDIMSPEIITINLSEGIMDTISIAYNLDYKKENVLNITVSGKQHIGMLKYLIDMGLVGSNIIINIFSDSDHTDDTSLEYYQKHFTKYTYIFGEVNIYYNLAYKDCGVSRDKIKLKRYRL
jgi:hypothetical protein